MFHIFVTEATAISVKTGSKIEINTKVVTGPPKVLKVRTAVASSKIFSFRRPLKNKKTFVYGSLAFQDLSSDSQETFYANYNVFQV